MSVADERCLVNVTRVNLVVPLQEGHNFEELGQLMYLLYYIIDIKILVTSNSNVMNAVTDLTILLIL